VKLKGETDTVIALETKSLMKPSSGVYMESLLEVLAPERPVKKLPKIKSFPCNRIGSLLTEDLDGERQFESTRHSTLWLCGFRR